MQPFNKYITVSLLRGRTPGTITGSLRAIGLSEEASFDDFKPFLAEKSTKSAIKLLKGMHTPESLLKHINVMERYGVKDFLTALASFSDVWAQHWDLLSVLRYRRFILTLLTAGYDISSITKEFNIKYSVTYSEQAVTLVRDYYWDLRKLHSVDRIAACKGIMDPKLRDALLAIVDGKKYEGVAEVGAKRIPGYEAILEEILADAYANYKKYYRKKDANSRAQLKVWLDVIVKIGDRHNKIKPKNTDELDDLIKKLEIDKKSKEAIPSLQAFIKDNDII